MSGLPDGIAGKAAAVGLLVVLLATFYLAVFSPVFAVYRNSALALDQRRELVRRYVSAVRQLPQLRALQSRSAALPNPSQLLLAGRSDSVATAELQSALKDIVENNGAEISNAAPLPASDTSSGSLRRVGARIAFSGDLEVLTSVLLEIQNARPVLSVSDLDLRVASDATPDPDAQNPELAVALDVFGFRGK